MGSGWVAAGAHCSRPVTMVPNLVVRTDSSTPCISPLHSPDIPGVPRYLFGAKTIKSRQQKKKKKQEQSVRQQGTEEAGKGGKRGREREVVGGRE